MSMNIANKLPVGILGQMAPLGKLAGAQEGGPEALLKDLAQIAMPGDVGGGAPAQGEHHGGLKGLAGELGKDLKFIPGLSSALTGFSQDGIKGAIKGSASVAIHALPGFIEGAAKGGGVVGGALGAYDGAQQGNITNQA